MVAAKFESYSINLQGKASDKKDRFRCTESYGFTKVESMSSRMGNHCNKQQIGGVPHTCLG
jgi:hypothetical protein